MKNRILVADDDAKTWVGYIEAELDDPDIKIDPAGTPKRCRSAVAQRKYDVVLLDIMYGSSNPSGFDMISEIKNANPDTKVIMFSSCDDKDTMLHSRRLGAGYLSKTRNSPKEIAQQLIEALSEDKNGDAEDDRKLAEEGIKLAKIHNVVFVSESMKNVFAQAAMAREKSGVHVLIRGEPGVGKELVAKAIGERHGSPLQTMNCAGLTDSIIQSELFGHEKGSYTGASSRSLGKLGEAKNGNIFFDEFGELSMMAQAKLLRAIEYGEVERVGAVKSSKLNFRVIAGTNANLESMVADGTFRQDFLDRFRRHQIFIPPLRERKEDIRPIIDHTITSYKTDKRFSADCMHLFEQYSWPGNVRELRDQILFLLDTVNRSVITINDIPERLLDSIYADKNSDSDIAANESDCIYFSSSLDIPFHDSVRAYEKYIIRNHIAKLGRSANKTSLADSMGVPRTNLRRKLNELDIDVADGR